MAKKILTLIDSAYRCTVEEQDEPAVWITEVMKGAGGDFTLLLQGNAVGYLVRGQDGSGLSFGGVKLTHPVSVDRDLTQIMGKGVEVYFVQDDAAERGLESSDFIAGAKPVNRAGVAKLFASHDLVWHW